MSNQASQNPPPNEINSQPKIEISLAYWLSLSIRGIAECANVSREFGLYLASIDIDENHIHVYLPEDRPTIAVIYTKDSWRTSLRREKYLKERAENARQIRFALEEQDKILKQKIQRKRDILDETKADIRKLKGVDVAKKLGEKRGLISWNQQEEFFTYLVFQALRGEHEKAAKVFGIEKELIEEFRNLPKDPEFNNKYLSGALDGFAT